VRALFETKAGGVFLGNVRTLGPPPALVYARGKTFILAKCGEPALYMDIARGCDEEDRDLNLAELGEGDILRLMKHIFGNPSEVNPDAAV
jgi:hypothetical protein